ncbi:MAG: SDR family oxidoreductase [Mesorhizobium sp.]|nr:SDR family oxidoreductase [Mesorhizobium sp. M4B.F.Ca.ET.088.02.2.1]RWF25108.1 MAG: SDR family oxidoreductase [Mesorhizobium sp.]TIX44043.1 MAG: SDR family oxidoreductase [Mesorhizobium sp.]
MHKLLTLGPTMKGRRNGNDHADALKLDQKCVLVTGASGAIGRCISSALAMAGAHLCLVARNQHRLDITADICRPLGRRVDVALCDLTNETAIDQLCGRIDQTFGHLDILVHCAGTMGQGRLEDTAAEQLDS